MAGSVNKVILIGNLGRDPEVRTFQNGGRIANLSLATSETWRDKASGERKERTEWHRIVILNDKLVEVAERFLKKGSRVFVQGQFRTRKWQDQSGQDRYTTEIVIGGFGGILTMLDGKPAGSGDSGRSASNEGTTTTHYGAHGGQSAGGFSDDLDDDIPF